MFFELSFFCFMFVSFNLCFYLPTDVFIFDNIYGNQLDGKIFSILPIFLKTKDEGKPIIR